MVSPLTSRKGLFAAYRRINERKAAGEEEKGFTLIELLIVVVVLGILAAVVVFALGGVTGKSAVAACEADGNTISTALAAFSANNPTTIPTPTLLTGTTDGGPYIQSWPSNLPHYAFALDATGKLDIATDAPTSVNGPVTTTTPITTPYTGVGSCDGVS